MSSGSDASALAFGKNSKSRMPNSNPFGAVRISESQFWSGRSENSVPSCDMNGAPLLAAMPPRVLSTRQMPSQILSQRFSGSLCTHTHHRAEHWVVVRGTGSEATDHRRGHRPWGYYNFIDKGERFQVKRIVVHPGARCRCRSSFALLSLATSSRTSCAPSRGTTSTASGVETMTRSSTPMTAASLSAEWMTQLCASSVTTVPWIALPSLSRSVMSRIASHDPISDQPKLPRCRR